VLLPVVFSRRVLASDIRVKAASRPARASTRMPVKSRTCHGKKTKPAARVARNVRFRTVVVD
jgi:hypothetical protein